MRDETTVLLVTGFEAFGGGTANPSGDGVRAMALRDAFGARVRYAVLPVTYADAPRIVCERAHALGRGVRACVMFGLAGGATRMRIERRATGRRHATMADNAGVVHTHTDDGTVLETAAPLQRIVGALEARGVPVEVSDDAGSFVCNATYRAVLGAGAPWSATSVFVHVPPTVAMGGSVTELELQRWMHAMVEAVLDAQCTTKG